MKVFKYKFTKLMNVLIAVALAISIAGIGVTVWQIASGAISSAAKPSYVIIQCVVMIFFSILLAIISISFWIRSYYAVDGDKFITCFGIIKSTYKISDITTIELDRKTDKLSVYFKGEEKNGVQYEGNYIVIVVKPDWNEQFVDAILKAKPEIEFSIKSQLPEDTDKKDKK